MPITINRVSFTIIFVLAFAFFNPIYSQSSTAVKLTKVVIDAGHGGKDPGALSPDQRVKEKDITLDVALKLGKKIEYAYPEVEVIYTRSKDVYVPLNTRSEIANKNHADLFISIHCNSIKGKVPASGSETYVMGMHKNEENMAVCQAENSVILLEDDYTTTYQGYDPNQPDSFILFNLMQNAYFEQSVIMASMVQNSLMLGPINKDRGVKQGGLLVLWKTTMPSILVELGFLSNSYDRKILSDKNKRTAIAERLFVAFVEFKRQYDMLLEDQLPKKVPISGSTTTEQTTQNLSQVSNEQPKTEPKVEKKVEPKVEKRVEYPKSDPTVTNSGIFYKIQIFALARKLNNGAPEFQGVKNYECNYVDGLYKYSVGNYKTKEDAYVDLSSYRKKFPGAFVIVVDKK